MSQVVGSLALDRAGGSAAERLQPPAAENPPTCMRSPRDPSGCAQYEAIRADIEIVGIVSTNPS
jgi:hypothetical protein